MSKKISELTQIINLTGEEMIPIAIDGQNKMVKVKNIKGADNLTEDYVEITGDDDNKYRVMVKNGKVVAVPSEVFEKDISNIVNKEYFGLVINQMYGGGNVTTGTPVSHGFIELYNFNNKDINLKGVYLWYRSKGSGWQSLALEGIIPAKHSFLIRGRQHTAPYSQGVRLNVMNYDMEWDMQFSEKGFSAYLCLGDETPEDNPVRQTKDGVSGVVNYVNERYIDLLGAGGKNSEDTVWAYETRYLNCMDENTAVHRVDYANSLLIANCQDVAKDTDYNIGSNASAKGNNKSDCEPIDYKTCNVAIYGPRCVADGRWNEFYDKPKQKETLPAMINVMYGEDGEHTRTFTFQTPLCENGFVKYRKEGEVKWISKETTTELFANVDGDTSVHRCIIHDLEVGKYEYQVGTDGCSSDIYSFEIKEYGQDDELRILWTTDQQAWTKKEYDVWQTAARFLNEKADQYDFHLNTGDISQNANRKFEWQYYYDYAKDITRNIPHVITCGNNDLIDKKYSDAFNYYITAENQFANSVYAFDLGYVHFVCLNSNEDMTHVGSGDNQWASKEAFLQAQADWLDEHLTEVEQREVQPRWVIVFAHLSPFTVGRTKRLQRWVAPVEKHKVDLFLCGHNHAWSRSKSIRTGYDFNVNPDYNDYVTVITGTKDLDIKEEKQANGEEVNRAEDLVNGTVYLLNQACGFKLSGKEKPLNLTGKVPDEKHINADGSPWWLAAQALPKNPVYMDLQITYDSIKVDSYEIRGVISVDEFKDATISKDLDSVTEHQFDTHTINYSEDRHK
jgi:hypothetical protein